MEANFIVIHCEYAEPEILESESIEQALVDFQEHSETARLYAVCEIKVGMKAVPLLATEGESQ